MGFLYLSVLPTIYLNPGVLSKPDKYRSAYLLEEGAVAAWFGIWGSWFFGGVVVGI